MPELTKHQVAYQALKGRILDGTFTPGRRVVVEAIARDLGVSAVPVREALRQLEAEGWLVHEPNVGTHVMALDTRQFAQVMVTLALLEGYATALSAPNLQAADLERARAINAELGEAAARSDPLRCTTLNERFHAVLTSGCDHGYLMSLLRHANERMNAVRRSVFLVIPQRAPRSAAEHDQLLALIADGAGPDEIEAFARRHKLRTLETLNGAMAGAGG
jgi:DNA-binding GntR family transcriptional regulator